ncbi:hypothetical protein [Arenimonas daejeonensis]|uniref:hypothetical protein n=1 Tax=Arenimonas daejeonensis TaxID=370777 RepID=UPI0011BDFCE9|nr:hypothetical protein [Arenimonas daejeonensis]
MASSAFAAESVATLSSQQGTVLVNQGEEFVTAADAQALQAGDRVMVMEGGNATITFADGCAFPLASGSLVEVPAVSTCAGAVATVQQVGPSYAQAVGGATHVEPASTWWVFGAFTAGMAIAYVEGDYSITPASP